MAWVTFSYYTRGTKLLLAIVQPDNRRNLTISELARLEAKLITKLQLQLVPNMVL